MNLNILESPTNIRIKDRSVYELSLPLTFALTLILYKIPAYPRMAEKTNEMQDIIQVDMAENPSTFGAMDITELNILINTKNRVTSRAILPATICGSIRKLTCNNDRQVKITQAHLAVA